MGQTDPKVLCLPDGLEVVGDGWFVKSNIEKLIVQNTVRVLGNSAFSGCRQLREVVFEPGSQLETIGDGCFSSCGIEQVTIPRSVRDIGSYAFWDCRSFRSLVFEDGSLLKHVGEDALGVTPLYNENWLFPSTAQVDDDVGQ